MNVTHRSFSFALFFISLFSFLFIALYPAGVGTAYSAGQRSNLPPDNRTSTTLVEDAGHITGTVSGKEIRFAGSFFDPGTDDTHIIKWDLGDGSSKWGTLSPKHTFKASGHYTVTLTVVDDDGGSAADFLIVDLLNSPPWLRNITVSPLEIDEGANFILSGQMSNATSHNAQTLFIDWGDGQTVSRRYTPGNISFSFRHTCVDDNPSGTPADSYNIDLKLSDDEGAFTTSTAVIKVNNVPPLVDIGSDRIVYAGQNVQFTAAITDPGLPDTHTVSWDFGDGSPPQAGMNSEHTFAQHGTYFVTATVEDDDGGTGQAMIKVEVLAVNYLPFMIGP